MYLDNKYTKWYNLIILSAQARLNNLGYTEQHHIIPRSLGGTNDSSNLVRLTPKEHFICHLLLTKMTTGNQRYKMVYALHMIVNVKNIGAGRYTPTSRSYDYAKRTVREVIDANWTSEKRKEHGKKTGAKSKGRKWTEESRLRFRDREWSEKAIANRLQNCLKAAAARKGVPWSEKRRIAGSKMSPDKMLIANRKRSEKLTGRKLSKGREGHVYPDENKITCEYCSKKLVPGYYYRFHGNNCKHK